MLEEEPDYINYIKELAIRNQRKGISTSVSEDIEKENPKKEVGSIIDNMNNEVSIELLDKIRNSDPYFFEQLVVDLLSRMGYSGEGGSAKVTSRSNDGGLMVLLIRTHLARVQYISKLKDTKKIIE